MDMEGIRGRFLFSNELTLANMLCPEAPIRHGRYWQGEEAFMLLSLKIRCQLCLIRKKTGFQATYVDSIVGSRCGSVDYLEIKEGIG